MTLAFMVPIAIRAVSAALVVVVASVLAEATGPLGGALVTSLPVSTGPAYVFMAMQHDPAFLARAALNGYAANAATGIYLMVYARIAMHHGLLRSLGLALLCWFGANAVFGAITWTPLTATALNAAIYGPALLWFRCGPATAPRPRPARLRRWYDLPTRAVAVALFVTVVATMSNLMGPVATGIIATFPITFSSVFCILHGRLGGAVTGRLATTALRNMIGFGLMLLAFHFAIEPWGMTAASLLALLVSLSWSGGVMVTALLQHRVATVQA